LLRGSKKAKIVVTNGKRAAETDGVFRFRNVAPGTYVARVQVVGHADVHIYGVEIQRAKDPF
jgi:hypothetical protein